MNIFVDLAVSCIWQNVFSKENLSNPPLHVAFSRSLINLIGFLSLCPQKWWPNLQNHAGAPVDAGKTGWIYSRPSLQQFRKDTIFRYIQIFNGLNCWCVWSICVKQRSDHHLKLRVKTSTATVLLSLNSIVTQSYSSEYPSSWYLDILKYYDSDIILVSFWYHLEKIGIDPIPVGSGFRGQSHGPHGPLGGHGLVASMSQQAMPQLGHNMWEIHRNPTRFIEIFKLEMTLEMTLTDFDHILTYWLW